MEKWFINEILGDATQLHVKIEGISEHIYVKLKGIVKVERDEIVHLTAEPHSMHFFDTSGNAIPTEGKIREITLSDLIGQS